MIGKKIRKTCINQIIAVTLGTLMLIGLIPISTQAATAEEKVIRVGYYENEGFQNYDAETGKYSGYSYEFLMALQQYTNWKYEFVPCTFSDGLTMLENGKLDIMNNVSKTAEREEVLDFSTLSSGENMAYLVMKAGDTRVAYEDLGAITQIKVGLAEDSIYSQRLMNYFEKEGVNANIVWYSSHEEVTEAFENDEVDAYVITSSKKTDEHIILSFSPDAYYIATTKGNNEIAQTLNSAIISLRANNPYFETHLKEKYYGQATENYTVLTEDEKQYIKENPVVRVSFQADWYPLSYKDENGDFAGAVRGVYDLLEQKTGLKFEYVPLDNTNESNDITEAYQSQIMAELPCDFSYAAQYDVKLSKSFVTPSLVEVANHHLTPGDTIALTDGDYLSELCKKLYGSEYNYVYCDSVDACMNRVKRDDADGTVLLSYESEYYRNKVKYSFLTYTIIDNGSYSLSIAVSNHADPRLYQIIQKGLNAISAGEILNVFDESLQDARDDDFLTLLYKNPIQTCFFIVLIGWLILMCTLGHMFIQKLKKQNMIINEQNEKLQFANSATNEFLSRVSHDMRTPMNGILGIVELSQEETNPVVLKESMGKIKSSGKYLLGLINDTLDYQRIESGKMTLDSQIVSIKQVIDNAVAMLQPTAQEKGVEFRVTMDEAEEDCYVRIDAMRVKQILVNLVSNAIKFTLEGGTVEARFTCKKYRETVHEVITITDTGIGMSEVFMKNGIFKPFSQESNEVTTNYAGSGLGLSIVKKLVDLMNGTITVESEAGVGSKFVVSIDFEIADKKEVEELPKKEKEKANTTLENLKGRQILLAEDHPLNAEIATRLLEKAGCHVTWAQNGKVAFETFAKSERDYFDVILMDIRMPVMDGLESAKVIRTLNRSDAKVIPIIAMTANAYDSDKKMSLEAGMNGHLAKPVEPMLMYETIVEILGDKSNDMN